MWWEAFEGVKDKVGRRQSNIPSLEHSPKICLLCLAKDTLGTFQAWNVFLKYAFCVRYFRLQISSLVILSLLGLLSGNSRSSTFPSAYWVWWSIKIFCKPLWAYNPWETPCQAFLLIHFNVSICSTVQSLSLCNFRVHFPRAFRWFVIFGLAWSKFKLHIIPYFLK